MTRFPLDPRSVAGKELAVAERADVLVVGAGPAGLAAAIEAAGRGASVLLVDENPVPAEAMAGDVPLHYGSRFSGAARNRTAMLEAVLAAEPLIERAMEAGVDVRLGTAAVGLHRNGPGLGWMGEGVTAILADDERSWLVEAPTAIVAAGRRDMGLAFPGWERPGVLGATAAERLARLGIFGGRRAVLLGSGTEALLAGLALTEAGVEVAALVEVEPASVGPADLVARLAATGTELLTGCAPREALGREEVEALRVEPLAGGPGRIVPCDTVLIGVGAVPVVELLDALGARLAFQPERGGHAPLLDADQRTSVPGVFAAGDGAGVWPAKSRDREVAEAEGRRAAAAAVAVLSGQVSTHVRHNLRHPEEPAQRASRRTQDGPGVLRDEPLSGSPQHDDGGGSASDLAAHRLAWVKACVVDTTAEPHVCQCEEVTAREILEVRPPRYLGAQEARNDRSLASLLGAGAPNPDLVKRLTRAGMGPCQGRRCREQVAALISLGSGVPLSDIPLASHRAPVRPLPLAVLADRAEPASMAEQWDTWFGMPAQWRPFWEVGRFYTAAGRASGPEAPSE
jgi:thioredoxin reductase